MMLKTMYSLIFAAAFLPSSAPASQMFFSMDDVGQMWLQIVGRIDDGDDVKFKDMLVEAINRGEQIARVSIYSVGGRVSPAMNIGRYIHTMQLSTVAPQLVPLLGRHTCDIHTMSGRTTVLEYEPFRNRGDSRCMCVGECFLIWAAGSVRYGDAVQIHRITVHPEDQAERSDAHAKDTWSSSREMIEEYLREMGLPEATIGRMFNIAPDRMEYLTKDERDIFAKGAASPSLTELFSARCGHHAAASPAALACEKAIVRELYWEGARRLLSGSD
jgi:hypothetical protein